MDYNFLKAFYGELAKALGWFYAEIVSIRKEAQKMLRYLILQDQADWKYVCDQEVALIFPLNLINSSSFPTRFSSKRMAKFAARSRHFELNDSASKYENCANVFVIEQSALSWLRQKFGIQSATKRLLYGFSKE